MATPHESAQSLMKLYDLRREEKMREARHWYIRSFNPASLDEVSSLMKTEKSATYVRMVLSYWEMAASFVVHGAIDRAMFYDASGEMLAVFCKLEHMIDDLRESSGFRPRLTNVEAVAADWPGSKERMVAMREYLADMAQR